MVAESLSAWLLDSDPALRWQVERDLVREPPEVWQATRARIAIEGFGARLLALQDPDGQWAGGSFFPADFDFHSPEAAEPVAQPWTATTWTLNSLREWGLDADGPARAPHRRASRRKQPLGLRRPAVLGAARSTAASTPGRSPTVCGSAPTSPASSTGSSNIGCPTAAGTANGSRAPTRSSLPLDAQLPQGTARLRRRDRRHRRDTRCADNPGEEYLLQRGLFRRLSTGEPVAPWVTQFVYPFRWTLQRAQRGRVLPPGLAARRRGAGPAHGRRDRAHPAARQPTARGSRPAGIPDACGSRSTCRSASRRSG